MGSLFNLSLLALAMLAFAGNSLLCRLALKGGAMDAAGFTAVRLVSGAITLAALVWLQRKPSPQGARTATLPGDGLSALALFVYAAGFSFAYLSMSAATGALLLFGAVQATMIAWGLYRGERLSPQQRRQAWRALPPCWLLGWPGALIRCWAGASPPTVALTLRR